MSKTMEIDKLLSDKQIAEQNEHAKNDYRIDIAVEKLEEIKEKVENKPNHKLTKIRVDRDLYYPIPTKLFASCVNREQLEDWKEKVVIEDWKALARRELFIEPEIETEKIIPDCGYYELEFELEDCEDCGNKPMYDSDNDTHYCPVCN